MTTETKVGVLEILCRLFSCETPCRHKDRDGVPPRLPGVYILYRGDDVFYVGQSLDVARRLHGNRHYSGNGITHIDVIACKAGKNQRVALEAALIWLLNPRANVAGKDWRD